MKRFYISAFKQQQPCSVGVGLLGGCPPLLECGSFLSMTREDLFSSLMAIPWQIDPNYGQSYHDPEDGAEYERLISEGRKHKLLSPDEVGVLKVLARQGWKHRQELIEWKRNEPRRAAQKFIGNKKIRAWLFNRDNHQCLMCGSSYQLSVDHINPVNRGGANRLGNLQTLCRSCNSWKSDNYIDLRK